MVKNVNGLSHVGIPCKNLEEAVRFYKSLDFLLDYENEDYKVAFVSINDLVLELYEVEKTALVDGAIDHFAIDCVNIDELFEKHKDKEILSKGIEELPFFENGVRFFIIKGPNNERVEYCERL